MCLCLHTPNLLKTREKPTTDFVFDFLRNMEGQKRQISSWQKVCQCGALPQISLCWDVLPQISILLRCSPTDLHRFTQIVRVRSVSHRISQMYGAKKSHRFHSAEIYSHRFHRFTQIVRVRSVSHRISQMYGAKKSHRFHSAEMFSHRFHRFTQIVWARSVSHRIHRIHRSMVQKNPTDFTEHAEVLA